MKSYILVVIQFLIIAILVLQARLAGINLISVLLIVCAVVIGAWALWVMRTSKITIYPVVSKSAKLITKGPYKCIRHPMYASVLLFSLGLLITNFNVSGSILYGILILDLNIKYRFEEKLLKEKFKEYKKYKESTKALIPFNY